MSPNSSNSDDPKRKQAPQPKPKRDADITDSGEKTAVLQGDQETLKRELERAKEQEACLIIIRGTPQGHRFFITQDAMVIGRDHEADISVMDQSISRKHARVIKDGNKVRISDTGSQNGTFVNNKKLAPGQDLELAKEDMIKLGNTIFKFLPAGELEILFYGNLGSAAHVDPLTKIYNKRYLTEALDAEFKRAKALHTDFSIIFFDLDFFRKINETYGHDGGDFALRELAALVRTSSLRPKDVFARYGGEEFVLLLGNTNAKTATEIAERIRVAVETHAFIYEGKRIQLTLSLGVAEMTPDMESPQTLIKSADKALYQSKNSGRNRVTTA